MTPREELIQAIERLRSMCRAHSPDDLVQVLLELLRVWQQEHSSKAAPPAPQKTVLERMGGKPKQMLSVGVCQIAIAAAI